MTSSLGNRGQTAQGSARFLTAAHDSMMLSNKYFNWKYWGNIVCPYLARTPEAGSSHEFQQHCCPVAALFSGVLQCMQLWRPGSVSPTCMRGLSGGKNISGTNTQSGILQACSGLWNNPWQGWMHFIFHYEQPLKYPRTQLIFFQKQILSSISCLPNFLINFSVQKKPCIFVSSFFKNAFVCM